MSKIEALIPTYVDAITIEGKSPRTVLSYENSLQHLLKLAPDLGLPSDVEAYSVDHVYQFLGALRDRGASASFRHRRQREIRTFFSWCSRMGFLSESVFARVPLVKLEQKIREPFSRAEVQQLLDSQDRAKYAGARNYALLLFLLDTGVRAAECVGVELSDVDWSEGRILIAHAKGQKQRRVALGPRALGSVVEYVEEFRGHKQGALFLTATQRPLASPSALHQILARLGDEAGVRKVYPHRFRHTFATWAIEGGAREIDVQLLLGHTSVVMTQRYARTYTSEQAVRAHSRLSPVGQLEGWAGPVPREAVVAEAERFHGDNHELPAQPARGTAAGRRTVMGAGMRFRATHKGVTYFCTVLEVDGALRFRLDDGAIAQSLSGAARAITQTQVNGFRFWSPCGADTSGTGTGDPSVAATVLASALSGTLTGGGVAQW